jgi:hypothetical protein
MSKWRLKGTILIACNCDWGCPCNFNARPSRGKCEGGWVWVIEDGHVDEVNVSGLSLALFSNWPGAIHEGGGVAACFVDDRADEAQRTVLTRLLHGQLGGPWAVFINTYQLSGPEAVRFNLELNGYDTRLRIGDAVDLQLQKIRNPVTHAAVHPEMILPEGIMTKHGRLAASKVSAVRGPVHFEHSGQYAAFGPFEYASA